MSTTPSRDGPQGGEPAAPHVAVLSIHPLYDTRIRNHLSALAAEGYRVTYVNWSGACPPGEADPFPGVCLVRRRASPVFGLNAIRFALALAWFLGQVLRLRPDLVHLHDLLLLPLAPPVKLALRRKVVFDVHEHYTRIPGLMGAFGRLCYRLFLPWVDGLVSVSESTMPATRKPAAVIPNYQQRSDFVKHSPPPAGAGRGVNVVYFGSLASEDRDVGLLLDVAERVLKERPEARFKIGGRLFGPGADAYRARLEGLASAHPERFRWFGEMSREGVLRESASADVGLLLLRPGGFNLTGSNPNKVFEYAAVGAAIVATDGFDIAGEVRESGAGLLFPAGADAGTVAAAVGDAISDPERLRRMKEASAALGAKYTWEAVAGRYGELYRRLVGRNGRAPGKGPGGPAGNAAAGA
jgi:glycosyltransferase involved in cell wall biosynthesis